MDIAKLQTNVYRYYHFTLNVFFGEHINNKLIDHDLNENRNTVAKESALKIMKNYIWYIQRKIRSKTLNFIFNFTF